MFEGEIPRLVGTYGYWIVAGMVGIESMGIPVPGETTLVAAAIYAGTTHNLRIGYVIAAAAAGAILGDNVGFWLGRELGYRLLRSHGRHVGFTDSRLKVGQYLFLRHGGKVVFFGRFIAVLRELAAFLAGANRMAWRPFLLYNGAGSIVWSGLYGGGAYLLGEQVERLIGPVGIGIGVVAVVVLGIAFFYLRRNEKRLETKAERALPGPITPLRKKIR